MACWLRSTLSRRDPGGSGGRWFRLLVRPEVDDRVDVLEDRVDPQGPFRDRSAIGPRSRPVRRSSWSRGVPVRNGEGIGQPLTESFFWLWKAYSGRSWRRHRRRIAGRGAGRDIEC